MKILNEAISLALGKIDVTFKLAKIARILSKLSSENEWSFTSAVQKNFNVASSKYALTRVTTLGY